MLTNLPLGSNIQDKNVVGDSIFMRSVGVVEKPLSGSIDKTWDAGKRLIYHIDNNKCGVPDSGEVTVEVIHEPSNSRIVEESLGSGFNPSFGDEIEPATAGRTSTRTSFVETNYGTAGNNGDEVDSITIDYDTDADFNDIDETDVNVRMTRTKADDLDRADIDVNSGSYFGPGFSGSSATLYFSGRFQTDVAGPIEITIDGIKNPSSSGSVEIKLKGDAGTKTIDKTLKIEN